MAGVEPGVLEGLLCVAGDLPEVLAALGLFYHDVQGLGCGSRGGRRHGGTEYERAGIVLEVVEDVVVSGDETAQGAEALGEGAHDEVYLVREAEVAGGAGAVFADYAESVGIVNHDGGVVLLAEFADAGDGGDVSLHRIHAVNHDELGGVAGGEPELLLQVCHVVVAELAYLAETQAAAVDDAGVVKGVEEDEASAEAEASDNSEVDLEAGAVGDGLFLANELGELGLKLLVNVQRAVEESAAGAAGAIFLDGGHRGLLEAGIV